jgi:hypothetical protein
VGGAGVAVEFAQGEGGDADVGGVVLTEQAGLDHEGGQRQGRVVAGDVQGRDAEQVPQGTAGALGLATGRQPVAEALLVDPGTGRVDEAHGKSGSCHLGPFGQREKGVPAQGGQHMQGARQRGPAEPAQGRGPARSGGGGQHAHVEAVLDRGVLGHAELAEQVTIGRAAAEEDVLAGVDGQAVAVERAGRAAEPGPGLEQGDRRARFGERDRGGDPGQAAADHGDRRRAAGAVRGAIGGGHPNLPDRALTATVAFSRPDSDIRPRRTAAGSAAMRSSRRR